MTPKHRILAIVDSREVKELLTSLDNSSRKIVFVPPDIRIVEQEIDKGGVLLLLENSPQIPDCLDFIQNVRNNDIAADIPLLLLLSDRSSDQLVGEALAAGINDFIFKPLEKQELLLRINQLLGLYDSLSTISSQYGVLEKLLPLTHTLVSSFNFQEILYNIVRTIADVVQVDRVSIVLAPEDPDVGFVVATSDDQQITRLRLDLQKYPEIQHVLTSKKPLSISDAQTHPLLDMVRDSYSEKGLSAVTLIPIVWEDQALGTLFIRAATHKGSLTSRQMFVCQALVDATAIALRNTRILQKLRMETQSITLASLETQKNLESLRQYADVFASSADGIAVFAPNGRLLLTNPGVQKILGYQEKELLDHPIWEVIPKQDHRNLIQIYKQLNRQQYPENWDVMVKRKDGERRIINCSFSALSDTGGAILVLFRDATDARRTRQELIETKNFLESLINTSVDAIIAHEPKGTIILYNIAAERIYGWRVEDVLHKMSVKALYPEGVARRIGRMLRAEEYGGVGRLGPIRIEANNSNGDVFPISLTAAFIYDKGVHTATFGIFTDLRETIRVERQLQKIQQQLEITEKQALIAELAGATAHELNQPLTGVMGYSEYLLRQLDEKSELIHAAEVIHREADRMAKIVRQIGKLTKYETRMYVGDQKILDFDRASSNDSDKPPKGNT